MKVNKREAYVDGWMHILYLLYNEHKRIAFVGYSSSYNSIRAKASKLQQDYGCEFITRIAKASAYENEVSMRNEQLLDLYLRVYEHGYKMLNKHVPGSPLDKEVMLMRKPELWHVLGCDSLMEAMV